MQDTLITCADSRCMQGACSLDYGRVSVAHWSRIGTRNPWAEVGFLTQIFFLHPTLIIDKKTSLPM